MVLLSAQKMPPARIAEVTFTSEDRMRDVIHNFNADGFDSLHPKYSGGRPRTLNLPEHREMKKIAKSEPIEHGLAAQPHRGPVHRAALLRPGRHRPPQPQGAGQHDPPLNHLAQPPR